MKYSMLRCKGKGAMLTFKNVFVQYIENWFQRYRNIIYRLLFYKENFKRGDVYIGNGDFKECIKFQQHENDGAASDQLIKVLPLIC